MAAQPPGISQKLLSELRKASAPKGIAFLGLHIPFNVVQQKKKHFVPLLPWVAYTESTVLIQHPGEPRGLHVPKAINCRTKI